MCQHGLQAPRIDRVIHQDGKVKVALGTCVSCGLRAKEIDQARAALPPEYGR